MHGRAHEGISDKLWAETVATMAKAANAYFIVSVGGELFMPWVETVE